MWNQETVARATGATVQGKWQALRVCIDSRNIKPGDLFVAIKGERVDGHEYVADALARGAVAALVSARPEGCDQNSSLAIVNDTIKALTDMAVFNRAHTSATVIGVTGSVGKTGTKEALKVGFAVHGNVYATEGNFNNHIGLPLTLANLPQDAKYAIFEMGMNHVGEISFLTRIVRPNIAIITNVEAVHLEFFDSVENIADAKAEIMEGITDEGAIILNRDNRYFERLRSHAEKRGLKNIISFGESDTSDVRLVEYYPSKSGCRIKAKAKCNDLEYMLGTIGKHYAMTSLSVLAAAYAAKVDVKKTAAALAAYSEPEGRGKFYPLPLPSGNGEYVLIDDCYNASPSSMEAAFAKLKELADGLGNKGRKVVILGDMLELGTASAELHMGLKPAIERAGVNAIFACGHNMKRLYDLFDGDIKAAYATNSEALLPLVKNGIRAGDVVLIKGSNGSKMKLIRDALKATSSTKELAHAV